jgi:hypothetical protein
MVTNSAFVSAHPETGEEMDPFGGAKAASFCAKAAVTERASKKRVNNLFIKGGLCLDQKEIRAKK